MSMENCGEVLRIVEELDKSQLKLEKHAFDVINSSDTSLNLVKSGIEEIDTLISKINDLDKMVQASRESIEQMKSVYEVIADFAQVIAGIANKTNMLSLNASIEAARAGEHGRGFAIVAKEVQNLASQTKNSSTDITTKIAEVQNYVKGTLDSMNGIFKSVEAQNSMASSIEDVLKKILEAAYVANDVSRNMENEIAYQRDITDKAKNSIESAY